MKTNLIPGLALAAALLIGGQASAQEIQTVAKPAARPRAAVAVVRAPATVARAPVAPLQRPSVALARAQSPAAIAASRRMATTPAAQAYARNSVVNGNVAANRSAFVNRKGAGSASSFAASGRTGSNRGQYAFASHQGWNHGSEYNWNGNHYRWYGNGWFIVSPYPYGYGDYGPNYYGTTYYAPGYSNYGGAPVSVQVQSALSQQGYYQGPIDGIVGPGTRAAISTYQQNNGLRVTGTITPGLLNNLGVS
jgi:hypothetical protein